MGLIFFKGPFWGAYFWRGLCMKGNLCLKIDWVSLILGRKFTVFLFFYFAFEGNFQVQAPRGAYIWRGLYMEGLIFGILRYVIHKPWKCPQLPMGMSAYRNVNIWSLSGSWNRFLWRRRLMEVSIRRVFTVDFLTNKCMNCIFLDRCWRELCIHQLPQI